MSRVISLLYLLLSFRFINFYTPIFYPLGRVGWRLSRVIGKYARIFILLFGFVVFKTDTVYNSLTM